MSDATHMTNFSGDKKAHPIYLTIGNLSSEVRTKPSSRATQLLAMLPPPPKRPDRSSEPVWREMKAQIRRVRNEALRVIMREFTDPDIMDGGIALCPDGQYRSIYMRIAAWIGDYQEHIDMQGLQSFRCPWCEVKPHELGKHIDEYEAEVGNGKRNTDNLRPRDRDHGEYKALFAQTSIPPPKPDDYRTQAEYRQAYQEYRDFLGDIRGKLTEAGVDAQYNPLWDLYQCQLPLLPKPDKLHTIYLGLVDHLMKWLTEMLQKYGRLHRFMEISKRIPPYLDMSAPRKSWMEVSQWTGREAKTMTRYLYATLAATLSEPPPKATEKEHFHDVLQATQALIEIVLYMEYDTHDEETLRLLRAAIRRFFAQKEAFLAYRAGKAARSTARAHHSHLVKERDAEIELARKDNKTPAEINEIRAFWAETIRIETQEAVEADSHFNFPKIHLLLHVVNSIEMFGSLGQFDSNISETAHKELKDGYRRSNRTGDWQIQVLNRWARSEAFDLRRNWQRKADEQRLHQSNMQPISDAFSSISVGDTPGRSRSLGFIPEGHTIPRPALFGPRVPTKKHGIPPIRTMFEVIESAKVHGFREAYEQYIKNSLDQPFSDNVHLRAPAGLYHGLELYNRKHGSEGRYRQRLRCTPGREWYGAKERKDWAWIQVNPSERRHDSNARMTTSAPRSRATLGALQGRLPVRLRCLFRVHLSDRSGKPRVFDLVLCEIPQPVDGGRPSESTGLVTVKRPGMPTANASRNQYQGYVNEEGANLLVFSAAVLDGPAHCVPLQHEGEELSWFVNPYIDLYTWNFVY